MNPEISPSAFIPINTTACIIDDPRFRRRRRGVEQTTGFGVQGDTLTCRSKLGTTGFFHQASTITKWSKNVSNIINDINVTTKYIKLPLSDAMTWWTQQPGRFQTSPRADVVSDEVLGVVPAAPPKISLAATTGALVTWAPSQRLQWFLKNLEKLSGFWMFLMVFGNDFWLMGLKLSANSNLVDDHPSQRMENECSSNHQSEITGWLLQLCRKGRKQLGKMLGSVSTKWALRFLRVKFKTCPVVSWVLAFGCAFVCTYDVATSYSIIPQPDNSWAFFAAGVWWTSNFRPFTIYLLSPWPIGARKPAWLNASVTLRSSSTTKSFSSTSVRKTQLVWWCIYRTGCVLCWKTTSNPFQLSTAFWDMMDMSTLALQNGST